MRAVIQRVDGARVVVDGEVVGAIEGLGLCVLVGVTHDDDDAKAEKLAERLWRLRVFPGDNELSSGMERSAEDIGAPLLLVSQFTLYGDTRKGRRPSWLAAAPGDVAGPIVDAVVARLRALGATVATGQFGAQMRLELVNHGPSTLIVEL
jgi:D-tyrosyl-tRNA(Tyr) deacylase